MSTRIFLVRRSGKPSCLPHWGNLLLHAGKQSSEILKMLYHTWLWTLFGDFGSCFRAGSGTYTLIGRVMDATWNSCWDVFARFHVLQPHWRCLKGLHSPRVAVSIDFEKCLGLVFLKVSIVGIGHPALIQAFILFPHFWNLQLVGDVIPLYFHCLQIFQENKTKQKNMASAIILSLGRLYWCRACPEIICQVNQWCNCAYCREVTTRISLITYI